MPVDPNTIGADRPVQNPQDAIEAAEGKYEDTVGKLRQDQTVAYMPAAPDPQPFTNLRGGK